MTPDQQQRLAEFLDQNVLWPRTLQRYAFLPHLTGPGGLDPRPSPPQLASELLAIAEFRSLQLGTWLQTPDGAAIRQAVELVSPPFLQTDIDLLVDALTIAAKLQRRHQQIAGLVAVGAVALFIGSVAAALVKPNN
jgi:hypothetical protein